MINGTFVSAIIPLYNEEKTIASVIDLVGKSTFIDEIICIDDGSTDTSLKILQNFTKSVKFITLKYNHGKGYALTKGLLRATGDIVIFLDADLKNLTTHHIELMLNTFVRTRADVVLGYCTGSPPKKWATLFKLVTGQRVYYRKDILPLLTTMKPLRHGVEAYLNNVFKNKKTVIIPLINLDHTYKHEKYPYPMAISETVRQFSEVMGTIHKYDGISYSSLTHYIDTLPDINKLRRIKSRIKRYLYLP